MAIREMELDDTIVATQEDADQEGSRVGLVPGTTYTVEQVVTGLLMQSGNDAAHALARKAGGMDAMVDKMNELLARLSPQARSVDSLAGHSFSLLPVLTSVIAAKRRAHEVRLLGQAAAEVVGDHQAGVAEHP